MTGPVHIPFCPAEQAVLDRLFATARSAGAEARLVGGVVRNWLMHHHHGLGFAADQDIDLAVSLPITEFAAAAARAGFSVYETGLAHGTVTLGLDGRTAEVTQLRTDADTDGRHARIQATDSWEEDARRRDFTINAVYLDADGQLFDPVGGHDDIRENRLRFVGEPARRLAEDHLRALRALRFLSVYPALTLAAADRAALAAHIRFLPALSAERIASELKRLMAGPAAMPVLRLCADMGVDRAVFDTDFRTRLFTHRGLAGLWPALDFALRLACCLEPGQRGPAARRLKLSRADSRLLDQADRPVSTDLAAGLLTPRWPRSAYRLGRTALVHALDYESGDYESGDYKSRDDESQDDEPKAGADTDRLSAERLRQIVFFRAPPCPVTGRAIVKRYGLSGPAVGAALGICERLWIDSDFSLPSDRLFALYDKMTKTEL